MMKNPIVELLESVVESGEEATPAERAVLADRGTHTERQTVKRGVHLAERKILRLLQEKNSASDDDVQVAVRKIIDETAEQFERFVVDEPSVVSAATNAIVDRIQKASRESGTANGQTSLDRAKVERRRTQPLRDLLTGVATGATLRDSDIDSLPLDPTVDEETRVRFRGDLGKSIRRIQKLHRSGNLADARDAAQTDAARYGGVLAGHRETDPAEGVTDGRELATLIRGRSAGNG